MINKGVGKNQVLMHLLAHITLVFSVFMILILFLDASDSSQQYINSYETGSLVTAYCVLLFFVSVLAAAKNYGHNVGGTAFALPHIAIVLSLTMLTLSITNYFNRSMGFITSDMSKMLLMALCVVGALTSLSLISASLKDK